MTWSWIAKHGISVCGSFWSSPWWCPVSHLQWPERVIHCDSAVTSLDFSSNNPSQLAVGLQDGSIIIYSVKSPDNKSCVISSTWGHTAPTVHHTLNIMLTTCYCSVLLCVCSECPNKHLDPVWQLRWTQQELSLTGEEKVESLFSVSADGRISKWFVCNNGLDCIGTVLRYSPWFYHCQLSMTCIVIKTLDWLFTQDSQSAAIVLA